MDYKMNHSFWQAVLDTNLFLKYNCETPFIFKASRFPTLGELWVKCVMPQRFNYIDEEEYFHFHKK